MIIYSRKIIQQNQIDNQTLWSSLKKRPKDVIGCVLEN